MICELISVGTEILLGDIVNTNAQYLSERLALLGFSVLNQATVGDNAQRLKNALDIAFSRSDTVITTGGLGPTKDDITKEVCSEYFGKKLVLHENLLDSIRCYFSAKKMPMPESNKKQAMMPEGAVIFENTNGTAPGCAIEKDGKRIIILPGPPGEMKAMFELSCEKYLRQFSDSVIISKTVRTFGIGESAMAQKVSELLDMENPTVAPYAKSGEALLRVTAKAKNEEKALDLLSPVVNEIQKRLGDCIYGIDADSIEQTVVELLKKKNLTVAVAESCTAGLVAKRLTDIPGASQVFGCGVVSYSNETKMNVLSVKEETLHKYSAVSEAVAAQMALGIKKLSGADFGASVTGLAGPDGDGSDKPVGLCFIAVTDGESIFIKKLLTGQKGSNCRSWNRIVFASNVLNEIRLFAEPYPLKRKDATDVDSILKKFL